MKNLLIVLIAGFIAEFSFAQIPVLSQKKSENIEMRIPFSEFNTNTIFHMMNIDGNLKVTGYDGDEIQITGKKTVWKKRGELTENDVEKVYLEKRRSGGHLYVFINAPGVEINEKNGELHYHIHLGDNWKDRKQKKVDTRFTFNLELKVPHYLMSEFSTINNGEVVVENMNNGVDANNVNGGVVLKEVAGPTNARTVNGDIEVWFSESPETDSDFHTVNGTIEIYSPKNLSTVVTFESLHGELYTDFDDIEYLPNRMSKDSDKGGTRYKIGRMAPIKIGKGGPEMSFKLVNGSVYIRQRKS